MGVKEKDAIYKYKINSKRTVIQQLGQNELKFSFEKEICLDYSVISENSDYLIAKIKFDSVKTVVDENTYDLPDQKKHNDSLLSRLNVLLKNLSFTASINKSSKKVERLDGYDIFIDRINDFERKQSMQQNKILEDFKNVYSEDYFKDFFEGRINYGPTIKNLRPNSTWTDDNLVMILRPFTVRSTYSVIKLDEYIAEIIANCKINANVDDDNFGSVVVEGDRVEKFELDVKKGIVLQNQTEINLKGYTKVGNKDITLLMHDIDKVFQYE